MCAMSEHVNRHQIQQVTLPPAQQPMLPTHLCRPDHTSRPQYQNKQCTSPPSGGTPCRAHKRRAVGARLPPSAVCLGESRDRHLRDAKAAQVGDDAKVLHTPRDHHVALEVLHAEHEQPYESTDTSVLDPTRTRENSKSRLHPSARDTFERRIQYVDINAYVLMSLYMCAEVRKCMATRGQGAHIYAITSLCIRVCVCWLACSLPPGVHAIRRSRRRHTCGFESD